MLDTITKFFDNAGDALVDAVLWPGQQVLSAIAYYSPGAAQWLGVQDGEASASMTLIFTLVVFFLLIVIATIIVRLITRWLRITRAIIHTIWFRVTLWLRELKTMLKLRLRRIQIWKKAHRFTETPVEELDDLDVAVLQSASAAGPGIAVSAPELAEKFRLRPAQVQRSLKKLSSFKMLDYVIGATDGYDNFRLTDYGAAFAANWQRQKAPA